MTTTTNVTPNGRIRKSLAEQIDRLDHILDGLSQALNESVADAVKQAVTLAVQEAVRGILAEVLANPEVLDKLRTSLGVMTSSVPVTIVPSAPVPRASRVAACLTRARAWLGTGWQKARGACGAVTGKARQALASVQDRWRLTRPFRMAVLTALGVGIVVGAIAYCGGPYIAALMGWIAGFTTTLIAQASALLRRTFAALEPSPTSPETAW